MNCTTTISVFDQFGSSIHTREASTILMNLIEKESCGYIEVDFSQVDYISRSFADQFYFDKTRYTVEFKKNVIISNANESVIHMLSAVAKTQNKKPNAFLNIPIYKYSTQSQLENFLLSI